MKAKYASPADEAELLLKADWTGDWFALRCSQKKTLQLVLALNNEGLRSWTPLWVRHRRMPRSNEFGKLLLPCLPSFAFLAVDDAEHAVRASKERAVPSFSVMRVMGRQVRLTDRSLQSLRKASDLDPRKTNPIKWPALGSRQKVVSGSFQGLVVVVQGRTARHCLVELEGENFPFIKMPPFLLAPIDS